MGLKDLVAQKAALTEEALESIVADYVRFDIDELEIAFTPGFAELESKAKILVYLVSLQGWPFVTDDDVSTDAKPADIAEKLGIPGGTVRRILAELKDSHLVSVKNSRYSVRLSNLDSIRKVVSGEDRRNNPEGRRKTAAKKRPRRAGSRKSNKAGNKKNKGIGETIDKWIAHGFFDNGRTTAEVRDRFHNEALIVPVSTIPYYVNKSVRTDRTLTRKKEEIDGKLVWVYRTKK